MSPKYTSPMLVGSRQVVKLRKTSIEGMLPGVRVVAYQLTHPHGRSNLGPKMFLMEREARSYAERQGWKVIG